MLDKSVLMPIHPRTKNRINKLNLKLNNVILVDPIGYLLMLSLITNSSMVVTDSGGLQKEAYFLNVPCTTLRDQTEWIETLSDNWNVLTKIERDEIVRNISRDTMNLEIKTNSLFGDGNASVKISKEIISTWDKKGIAI
jgi:UDP-N-acetylglucosamine 2-epimerase